MFMCCTKWSSVINSIYSGQQVFSDNLVTIYLIVTYLSCYYLPIWLIALLSTLHLYTFPVTFHLVFTYLSCNSTIQLYNFLVSFYLHHSYPNVSAFNKLAPSGLTQNWFSLLSGSILAGKLKELVYGRQRNCKCWSKSVKCHDWANNTIQTNFVKLFCVVYIFWLIRSGILHHTT